jgi:hypothetical protein
MTKATQFTPANPEATTEDVLTDVLGKGAQKMLIAASTKKLRPTLINIATCEMKLAAAWLSATGSAPSAPFRLASEACISKGQESMIAARTRVDSASSLTARFSRPICVERSPWKI